MKGSICGYGRLEGRAKRAPVDPVVARRDRVGLVVMIRNNIRTS
jgi:hypothetical protein